MIGTTDYKIVPSEKKRHYDIYTWHKGVPNFHIWHKRVPRIFYIYFLRIHSKISLQLRHNVPQACNEKFCSRGPKIKQLIGSCKDQMFLPSHYS